MAKRSNEVPFGTMMSLPVWECRECDGWQPAVNEAGDAVHPRACKVCGPGQRYRRTIGFCNDHKPIVVALAAKGWRFTPDVQKWAGVAETA